MKLVHNKIYRIDCTITEYSGTGATTRKRMIRYFQWHAKKADIDKDNVRSCKCWDATFEFGGGWFLSPESLKEDWVYKVEPAGELIVMKLRKKIR